MPIASKETPNSPDEKVYKTVHITIGDNTSHDGGTNPSCIHLDGIILNPTLAIDGKTVIDNGKLVV